MHNLRKQLYLKTIFICIVVILLAGCQAPMNLQNGGVNVEDVIITSQVDYADQNNWAYFGIGNKEVDLFLICPTTFKGSESVLNMSVDDDKSRERFVGALNMERGIYEEDCKMYAPFYSQAALYAYKNDDYENGECFNIAYADVQAAFVYYMKHLNNNRPFVLAGFSQGSDMALRLMKEFWGNKKYESLNIASYLIGWRVTEEDIEDFPFLKMADGETDTGCIISFNTEAEQVETSIIVKDKTLGINPLNWSVSSDLASAEYNKGACFTDYSGKITKEIPNLTGAYLDPKRGTLKVTDIDPAEYPVDAELFGEGVYHVYDYQFFYRNLQENVTKRIEAYLNK